MTLTIWITVGVVAWLLLSVLLALFLARVIRLREEPCSRDQGDDQRASRQ